MKCVLILLSLLLMGAVAPSDQIDSIMEGDALLIIDVQNCFMETDDFKGSLGVGGSKEIIAHINNYISAFEKVEKAHIIVTADWHPKDHCSFQQGKGAPTLCPAKHTDGETSDLCKKPEDYCQDSHTKANLEKEPKLGGGTMAWPAHCVGDLEGDDRDGITSAALWKGLTFTKEVNVVKKGFVPNLDSYDGVGGFKDPKAGNVIKGGQIDMNWDFGPQQMTDAVYGTEEGATKPKEKGERKEYMSTPELLEFLEIKRTITVGIATDYCVLETMKALNPLMKEQKNSMIAIDGVAGVNLGNPTGATIPPAIDLIGDKFGTWVFASPQVNGAFCSVTKKTAKDFSMAIATPFAEDQKTLQKESVVARNEFIEKHKTMNLPEDKTKNPSGGKKKNPSGGTTLNPRQTKSTILKRKDTLDKIEAKAKGETTKKK